MQEQLGRRHTTTHCCFSKNHDLKTLKLGLFCLATACFFARQAFASGDLSRSGRSLAVIGSPEPDDSGLLVVTLLDGRVVAVRQDSGEKLWTYDTGTPLVTVKQGNAMAPGLRIFPGVDGGLYAYGSVLPAADATGASAAKLERLPITLPELVDSSPSLTDDGSVILGKRLTRVYVLDRVTGALLHVLSDGASAVPGEGPTQAGEAPPPRSASFSSSGGFGLEDMPVLQLMDPERVVLVGREDYVVRSLQVHTGVETWNATYSRMVQLGAGGAAAGQRMGAQLPGGGSASAGAPSSAALPVFTIGADHTLRAHDPASRMRRWSIPFDTPPVGVFGDRHGDTNFLNPASFGQQQQQSKRPAGGGFRGADGGLLVEGTVPPPAAAPGAGPGGKQLVLLGLLPTGVPYAMPADHMMLDEQVKPEPLGVVARIVPPRPIPSGPWTGPGPAIPQLPPTPSPAGGEDKALAVIPGSSGSAVDVLTYMTEYDGVGAEGLVSGLSCKPRLQLIATVDEPTDVRQPWLPDANRGGNGGELSGGVSGSRAGGSSNSSAGGVGGRGAAIGVVPGGALLSVVLLAAGAGAATVLVVLRVRGGGGAAGPITAAGKASDGAAADAAAAATSAASREAPLELDAVAGGGTAAAAAAAAAGRGAAKAAAGSGGANGGGGGPRRRKGGRAATGGGSGGGMAARDSSQEDSASAVATVAPMAGGVGAGLEGPLPKIDEDAQLSPSAAPSTSLGSLSPPGAAADLPSAEPRVRVMPDGSLAIGRLRVGPGILGYGSAGTIVYEGVLDGRPVAVKRLLRQFTELARKEIEVLILSDEHPNVVRCFALEEDREFVYLALERCRSTLSDFLDTPAGRIAFVDSDSRQPTARCTSTMLDICRGLAALHERGVVHRDLKPHNVLLTEVSQRAKLSDMGLSKQLVPEQSSFESHHGPGGSSGWQAPEQLIARDGGAARQTRSMDVFSLGCILYYCMTGGRHPFGDNHYERDANILHGPPSLAPLAASAGHEAANLVASCLAKDPARRPSVAAVLQHPLWWGDERRLSFLVDISDRLENEDREPDTTLLTALESFAAVALAGLNHPGLADMGAPAVPARSAGIAAAEGGSAASGNASLASSSSAFSAALASAAVPNWGAVLPGELVANLGRYRRYDFTSLRDLLRVVRNKRNHFREMPPGLQTMLGPLPGGFLRFFTARFPRLVLAVYMFGVRHLADEPHLQPYWRGEDGEAANSQPFVQTFLSHYGPHLKPVKTSAASQPQPPPPCQPQSQTPSQTPPPPSATTRGGGDGPSGELDDASAAAAAEAEAAAAEATVGGIGTGSDPAAVSEHGNGDLPWAVGASLDASQARVTSSSANAAPRPPLPDLPSDPFSSPLATTPPPTNHHINNGWAPSGPLPATPPPLPLSRPFIPPSTSASTPQPPQPPPQPPAPLVVVGYTPSGDDGECFIREFPRRPGKQHCDFYLKTGHCKFGDTCVFDHPESLAVRLTALGLPLRPAEPLCSFYLKNNECRFGPTCKFHHPLLRPVYAGSAVAGVGAGPVVAPCGPGTGG